LPAIIRRPRDAVIVAYDNDKVSSL
jgi:hypothetical protein